MESASTKASPSVSTSSAMLRKRTIAWSLETGLPASVHVRVGGKIFDLHKFPLVSKSGYFRKALLDSSSDVELPAAFPGGAEAFEMAVLCCYGSPLPFDPFNVAALRCAAHVLEMEADRPSSGGGGGVCERSDLYLNQVVLQSWDDTLIVLQKCRTLLPWAEDLLIVSRCVESLAFMACMEILDPDRSRNWPVAALHVLAGRNWSCETVKEMAGQDLWVKDLIALPFEFFKRIIGSLRRQGMKEKYVSPIVVFYANKWVLSRKTHNFWENTDERSGNNDANDKVSAILEGVLQLLPTGERASRVIPAEFYFSLLSRSMALRLSNESRTRLQDQVASLLHLAHIEDFLLPESSPYSIISTPEFQAMERIVSISISASKREACYSEGTPLSPNYTVAELWDRYLSQIAVDPKLEPGRFMELIEIIPMDDRETHDYLYRALNTFLMEHPRLTTEDKASVCKYLNCQKLSEEVCIEAVQNELMPLRLIVQALFVQQLHTHRAFKECSGSFRYINYGEFSGSISSSRGQVPVSQNLGESPFKQEPGEGEVAATGPPLGTLLKKEAASQRSEFTKADYESTSFRLQALEQELVSLKQSLRWQNVSKGSDHVAQKTESFRLFKSEGRSVAKKRNALGQAGSCIGSMSWATQRRYAGRVLKVFRRITLLGKGKSKTKKAASGLPTSSLPCRSKTLHEMYV
ncbi:F-box proteinisoform X1 [Iris pallida]|uniref:F-box proteinisoform X1 n=1 Tax=Iris pallida TaxID=29817 RepID=A0AAX6FGM0_IRIPA|nr:F-box proteinisoform X1 [Iris pallida]